MDNLTKDIGNYQSIKVIGNGNSALSAEQLVYSMYSEEKFIDSVDTTIKIDYLSNVLNKNYLLIIFSVTGSTNTYANLLQEARKKGTKTYLITMNQESELLALTDYYIVLPTTHVENSDSTLHRVDSRAVLYVFAEMISYYYSKKVSE